MLSSFNSVAKAHGQGKIVPSKRVSLIPATKFVFTQGICVTKYDQTRFSVVLSSFSTSNVVHALLASAVNLSIFRG